jgi:hypothetical protein
MIRLIKKASSYFSFFFLLGISFPTLAYDPWFTGPIIAAAGQTIPAGHVNFEPYFFDTDNIGNFNRHWKLIHSPRSDTLQFLPVVSWGLTDKTDFQVSIPYNKNKNQGEKYEYIGDANIILGYQAFKQGESKWHPNLRLTLQEILPSGHYQHLKPSFLGTDATGLGSYQTSLGLNFEHLLPIYHCFLRSRLSLNALYADKAHVEGVNSYGGAPDTNGSVTPGNLWSADLGEEFSLTQSWVLVMEGYYVSRGGTHFRGNPGLTSLGTTAMLNHGNDSELSFAPAIEYNFSENYGLIAGVWYSAEGRDTPDFNSTVIAFNAYW